MMQIDDFIKTVWGYYRLFRREMPWRNTRDPYRIFVSEVMLQQTQVSAVLKKYPPFLRKFPDFLTLSRASLADIMGLWKGLGYNRRAKYLLDASKKILTEWKGTVPSDPSKLETLSGVGPATARSLVAFIYNEPVVFIETNIRRIYIHHFFHGQTEIHDRQILPLVGKTLDIKRPREWYWALMDYGAHLKTLVGNPNRQSRHYTIQKPFVGSDREIRGKIMHHLLKTNPIPKKYLIRRIDADAGRIERILKDLIREEMIKLTGNFVKFV